MKINLMSSDNSQLTTIDILRYRAGVCREFVKLFEEMCQVSVRWQVPGAR